MAHVNITASETGGNTGSCGQLTDYLEKENQKLGKNELWFDQARDDIGPDQVKSRIDNNVAKLKKTEAEYSVESEPPSELQTEPLCRDIISGGTSSPGSRVISPQIACHCNRQKGLPMY